MSEKGFVDHMWLIIIGMVSIAEALRQQHNENVEVLLGQLPFLVFQAQSSEPFLLF
jgi:hypothetical protein